MQNKALSLIFFRKGNKQQSLQLQIFIQCCQKILKLILISTIKSILDSCDQEKLFEAGNWLALRLSSIYLADLLTYMGLFVLAFVSR